MTDTTTETTDTTQANTTQPRIRRASIARDNWPPGSTLSRWWPSNGPGAVRAHVGNEALVFQVEFCDMGTLVHGRTWGEMKTVYR